MSKLAIVQKPPAFLNKKETIGSTASFIGETASEGASLVLFPEAYIPGYPAWIWRLKPGKDWKLSDELYSRLLEDSVSLEGEDLAPISEAARKHKVTVVCGINERDTSLSRVTLYKTTVVIGPDGALLNRHRKLMPTHSERVYWGMGDAADIRVFPLDIGVVGGLICYEHHMTLLRAAMAIKGEEIHCAVWPGWWKVDKHLGGKSPEPGSETCDIEPAIREYAIENQAFVVSSSWFLKPEDVPADLRDSMRYNLAVGGSCIVNPAGLYLKGPVFNEESIVWADIQAEDRRLAKAYFDCLGHYARFDLLSLNIREQPYAPTGTRAPGTEPAEPQRDPDLRRLAYRYGIRVEDLEAYLARNVSHAE
jgi:predicted amidohydrolase